MAIHAVVTVDLDSGVTTSQRNKFNQYLKDQNFTKRKLTTIWTVVFVETATKVSAAAYVRRHVDEAASSAGINNFEALYSLSDGPVVEWAKGAPSNRGIGSVALSRG